MTRLTRAWRALSPEQRLAAIAALALFVTMLLPWYQQNGVDKAGIVSQDLDAFAVFSFIEAAILLVAIGALVLLFARAEGRAFHLPGSDGTVVLTGGLWTALLLVIRLFDKPSVSAHGIAANVGVQWGIFFALGAAGLLAWAGARMRSAERPEPPLMRSGRRSRRSPRERERRSVQERRPRRARRGESFETVEQRETFDGDRSEDVTELVSTEGGPSGSANAGPAAVPARAPVPPRAPIPARTPVHPRAPIPPRAPASPRTPTPPRTPKRSGSRDRAPEEQLSFDDAQLPPESA